MKKYKKYTNSWRSIRLDRGVTTRPSTCPQRPRVQRNLRRGVPNDHSNATAFVKGGTLARTDKADYRDLVRQASLKYWRRIYKKIFTKKCCPRLFNANIRSNYKQLECAY